MLTWWCVNSSSVLSCEQDNLTCVWVQLPACGLKPNTAFIGKSLGADVLSSTGYVKVQPTLQLINHPDIFAVGDVVDNTEQKEGVKAGAHGKVVAGNLVGLFEGKPLRRYAGSKEIIILTIGKVRSYCQYRAPSML